MRKCKFIILKIIASSALSLVFLSIFSLGYKYTGAHIDNISGSTDFKWRANQYIGEMDEGLGYMRVDDNGFNNIPDGSKQINILFMGSSNVEAFNVNQKDNMVERLQKYTGLNVYSIGISGHYLDDNVDNYDAAVSEFKPTDYVVIETSNINLDKKEMQAVLNGMREKQVSQKGFIAEISRKLPAVKLIYLRLNDWKRVPYISDTTKDGMNMDMDSVLLDDFLSLIGRDKTKLSESEDVPKTIILYQPSTRIDAEGHYIDSTNQKALQIFNKTCDKHGIIFVDMTASFKELYENKNILAHGFANTAVGVGHLNRYGHKIIAEKLAEVIREDMEKNVS